MRAEQCLPADQVHLWRGEANPVPIRLPPSAEAAKGALAHQVEPVAEEPPVDFRAARRKHRNEDPQAVDAAGDNKAVFEIRAKNRNQSRISNLESRIAC
jgi:hypothetical protein